MSALACRGGDERVELVLEVEDLERAERFYAEVLALPVVERWPHPDAIWVLAGATRIGLWRPQVGLEEARAGSTSFAMQIADDDFDARVEAIRAHGHEVPVHEFGEYHRTARRRRARRTSDPDGH